MLEIQASTPNGERTLEPDAASSGAELSIVIPTFKERDNVVELIRRVRDKLEGCDWEIIFVDDDSPDDTAFVVRQIARRDHRVRCIQRIGRRGLSSACIEGMMTSSADYLAVIDGDLQHDEALLPTMLAILKEGDTDIVVGSVWNYAVTMVYTWQKPRRS